MECCFAQGSELRAISRLFVYFLQYYVDKGADRQSDVSCVKVGDQ